MIVSGMGNWLSDTFGPGGSLVCSLPNFITGGGTERCDLQAHAGDYPAPPPPAAPAPPVGWDTPGVLLDPATTGTQQTTVDQLRQFFAGVDATVQQNQPQQQSGIGTIAWVLAGAAVLLLVVKR